MVAYYAMWGLAIVVFALASGDYPAWEYRRDSRLRELMTEVFREQYGREPKGEAIHAGLEGGPMVAYYAMWGLAIVVFALAVYYTVKQL